MTTRRGLQLSLLLPLLGLFACGDPAPPPERKNAAAPPTPATPAPRPARQPIVDRGDLDRIRERGALRVVLFGREEAFLPREGMSANEELELAGEFARSLGVKPEFFRAERLKDVIPLLVAGQADLAAARLTVTRSRQSEVAFTRPMTVVNEILVGRKGASGLPRSIADLAGRTVHVHQASAHAETLADLSEALPRPIRLEPVDERLDSEQLAHQVGEGAIPLTVVDSNQLEAIRLYNDSVQGLFPVRQDRGIAWAVRKENPKLKSAADAFLVRNALTGHKRERLFADLGEIQKRRFIRVLTRNNAVTYFLYKGRQYGFDYELARLMAKRLGVHLAMVVPPRAADLVPWLLEGRGDVIAASFTVTPARKKKVDFSLPYLYVDEILVGRRDAPVLGSFADLKDRTIHVRASSSYVLTLARLHRRFGPFNARRVDETVETEMLLDRVARGEIAHTVSDSHILDVERTHTDEVKGLLRLTSAPEGAVDHIGKPRQGAKEIAFAVRKNNPELKRFLDQFVQRIYRGGDYNTIRKRYFQTPKTVARARASLADKGRISPYDDIIKKYAARYGFDWRLLAAQAYQESRFNPKARSWSGACGLFQVMPATGRDMGFTDLDDPEDCTHAGVKYMAWLLARFDKKIPLRDRLRFTLASYNCGRGHVLDAMRLAQQRGLDPHRWFNNVEKALLLLKDPKIHRKTRYGYCRADEPVNYVAEIQVRYDNYLTLVPDRP